jgi:hypothetical protein
VKATRYIGRRSYWRHGLTGCADADRARLARIAAGYARKARPAAQKRAAMPAAAASPCVRWKMATRPQLIPAPMIAFPRMSSDLSRHRMYRTRHDDLDGRGRLSSTRAGSHETAADRLATIRPRILRESWDRRPTIGVEVSRVKESRRGVGLRTARRVAAKRRRSAMRDRRIRDNPR